MPRGVTPTNCDVDIHDGVQSRNRFLRIELKTRRETWPPSRGQSQYLCGLAAIPNFTVRIARGDTRSLDLFTVTAEGVASQPIRTHAEALRRAIHSWVAGEKWRDAEILLDPAGAAEVMADHVCGWARVDGLWTCVQDHYAVGFRPDTACGATLPQFA